MARMGLFLPQGKPNHGTQGLLTPLLLAFVESGYGVFLLRSSATHNVAEGQPIG